MVPFSFLHLVVMKNKIRQFVQQSGGRASALAIVRSVLHMRNATPVVAERLLSTMLQNDPRLAPDGLGNWHLVASAESESQKLAPINIFVIDTPMRYREVIAASRLVLGLSAFREGQEAKVETYTVSLSRESRGNEPAGEQSVTSAQEFIDQWWPVLLEAVIVSWHPRTVHAALGRIGASAGLPFYADTMISLQTLARNLLHLVRPPKLQTLYRELFAASTWEDSHPNQVRSQTEILAQLVKTCHDRGLKTWEQIATFASKPERADFGSFEFEESYVENLPEAPGVYLMKDRQGHVIYVGKAANLKQRVQSYFRAANPTEPKLQAILANLAHLSYEVVDTELDALLREQALIRRFQPAANKQFFIHADAHTQSENVRGIFLVPVHQHYLPKTKNRVIIYVLARQELQRFSAVAGRKPGKRLRQAVAELFHRHHATAERGDSAATIGPQVAIASRWLRQNRNWVSSIDIEDCASTEDVEARLIDLLRSPEIFQTSVRLRPAESPATA